MENLPFDYQTKFPPVFYVEAKCGASACPQKSDDYYISGYPTADNDPKDWTKDILIEAYRGMRNMYGNRLYFSMPQRSTSFVYRSEREFLESYSERFAWCLHFYESTHKTGHFAPGRYSGILFLRPWNIHCHESREPEKAKDHSCDSSPSICEGYLLPPHYIKLSPYFSSCSHHYASRYYSLPFSAIPFASAQHGGACGHSVLFAALLMSNSKVTLSPYEIAVASASFSNISHQQGGYRPITGLRLKDAKAIVENICHGKARFLIYSIRDKETGNISEEDERAFIDMVSAYLYQGIPVIYAVDYSYLYPDETAQARMPPIPGEKSDEKNSHMILIHGIARTKSPNKLPILIFADSMNLHTKGNIFHQASARRMIAARYRGCSDEQKAKANGLQSRDEMGARALYLECVMLACVPECLVLDSSQCLNKDQILQKKAHLRAKAQLEGYLLSKIFPDIYEDTVRCYEKIQEFRLRFGSFDVSRYLWIIENIDNNGNLLSGSIFDTRSTEIFCGEFYLSEKTVTLNGNIEGHDMQLVVKEKNGNLIIE
ncbi:MAG: hypothetical protein NTX50_30010 [Candidatus Sumerlaeota bacterium]|nr:hypothetical protein [Candidatus Sumerlaeota bacterium]